MTKALKLGVIGACTRGALADNAMRLDQNVRIVAGAEPYEHRQKSFLERIQEEFHYAPAVYADYKEMLAKEELDGVFITTPDFLHEEIACYCLEHKIPVYLEKPIAITVEGADRVLETARRTGTRLFLGHNMRYMRFTNKMREIIQSGIIGDVKAIWCRHFISYGGDAYFRDWHADRARTCSLLLQKGAHDIDIIHWLADSYSVRVNGLGALSVYGDVPRRPADQKLLSGVGIKDHWKKEHWPPSTLKDFYPEVNNEDINMIQMQLANGVQACYLQCHFTPDQLRNYTVIGTKGRLENLGGEMKGATIEVWTRRTDTFHREGDITFRLPDPSEGNHGGADLRIVSDFLAVLRGTLVPACTPQGARNAVVTGVLGAQSIRNGGMPYEIPVLSPEMAAYDFSHNK